jgi:hypothetical protein
VTVIRSTDHVERGIDKFIGPLKQPKVQAWAATKLRIIQRIEDMAWEVADYLNVENGFGKILDMFGSLLDRGRNGLVDDAYRVAIYAQGRILRAIGNDADVQEVGDLSTTPQTGLIETYDYPPASFIIEVVDALGGVAFEPLRVNMAEIKPLGSRSDLVWCGEIARANTFICGIEGEDGEPEQGCGIESDPDVGGRLSAVVKL